VWRAEVGYKCAGEVSKGTILERIDVGVGLMT
jgi:hypothetical protein